MSDGLGTAAAFAWALDLDSDGVLYLALNTLAGSGEGGIYKSANGGTTWTRIYAGEDVLSVAADPLDAQSIYAGTTDDYSWSTAGGVLKSGDGGQSWTRVLEQPRGGFVLPHPSERGLVLAASQPWWNYTPGALDRGVYLSRDGGATWTNASEGLGHRFVLAARFNPHDPSQVLVATHGGGVWLGELESVSVATSVREAYTATFPQSFSLEQSYPNPFNSNTVIGFALPESDKVELTVYNLAGQKAAVLVEGAREAGTYTVHWDGRDASGRHLASGVYLYRLRAGAQVETRRLLLLR